MIERVLLSLVSISLWASLLSAQTTVLFLGNSYTAANDLPNTFRQLALSLGEEVTVSASTPGGYTLEQHATYAPSLSLIDAQPWDFVVMQEQSQLGALPVDVTNTELGATQLLAELEENYECTYPVFYMTWGRQNGDPDNCPAFPFMCTYDGMQQGLRNNYVALANWNDAYTAPVGVAWKQVRDTHPLINLYAADGSHPSVEGTYLAACVFYCTIFQESCVDAAFNSSLPPDTAAILRSIASATVLDEPETWNLDVPNGTDAFLDGFSSGPDYITLIHNGQGTHLWTCSNGQSFTTATVTFTFDTSGVYTVVHTYTDPCGNTATANLTFTIVVTVGVVEQDAGSRYQVRAGPPGIVEVHGVQGVATLNLFDAQGRMLSNERINSSEAQVPCPTGLLFWTLTDERGTRLRGKVLVH
ncbi:MAG TPA: hypothetical protein PLV08_07070 [Flavobacteriales bacterium]|jgi:hypothetical protein|nr:hypothetical protein [Flavobacteriales bacterium]MBK8709028.1 hypothetical protein [Flavobacteriales bacterium]HQW06576.1 hypothetical protein [Flavobacteriales bacterium]HQW99639.1 hypothetical protein [Flavobacteriales bacterium]HQX99518.1 hypothetical protein [Flavobacteriales bacterium]